MIMSLLGAFSLAAVAEEHRADAAALVRTSRPEDAAEIERLWGPHVFPASRVGHELQQASAAPACAFWVAEVDGRIVGVVGAMEVARHVAEIRRMWVGQGRLDSVAEARLLHSAASYCRDRGFLKVVVELEAGDAPTGLHEDRGGLHLSRLRTTDGRRTAEFYLDLYHSPRAVK